MVVLFWAQPHPTLPSVGASLWAGNGVVDEAEETGDVALSGAVLAVLKALSMEMQGARVLKSDEGLGRALDLVLALWQAEGVGRLGQVRLGCGWFLRGRESFRW